MGFQYPLFRIELLSRAFSGPTHRPMVFQYPLFRIELLSNTALSTTAFAWKVSISALSDRIAQLLNGIGAGAADIQFQYPLFRIELLSRTHRRHSRVAARCFNIRSFGSNCSAIYDSIAGWITVTVSISALSDRIAQQAYQQPVAWHTDRFNIRSFGSNCSANSHALHN